MKEHTYYVKGMHCASCEILIEKKLLEIPGVKSVEASTGKGMVIVECDNEKPGAEKLNNIFKKDGYLFFNNEYEIKNASAEKKFANKTLLAFNIAMFIIVAFLLLDRTGVSEFLNIASGSSLLAFFGFGLLAGLSSCAALVGGMVLSMSKQWQEIYADEQSNFKKFQPHLIFNVGRILSYAILGGLLGLAGSRLQPSLSVASFLIIAVSFLMIALGLQMLGVRAFRRFQFSLPKFITRKIANENNFNGKYMPFVMGAFTFFLPCGFTVVAQSLALLSGNPIQGGLIMGFFALGTAPMLLFIGLSSVKFLEKPHLSQTFSKVAGFLLLFFALFNINTQMSVLGVSAVSVFTNSGKTVSTDENELAPIINGKQVVKMTVYASKYAPNYFKVKAGVPVKWEITSSGQPSCDAGAIVSRGLLDGPVYLNPNVGQVTVAEFVPDTPGKYQFSCTMGMVRGMIEVID